MSQYHKYFRLSSCIVNNKMDHLLRVVVGGGGAGTLFLYNFCEWVASSCIFKGQGHKCLKYNFFVILNVDFFIDVVKLTYLLKNSVGKTSHNTLSCPW
jgi:hypothetical protein